MAKSLLHAAGLGTEYWTYALNHSVYLSNRLYHSTIKLTPYQKLRHSPPSLKHLRVFGSKVYYNHTKTNQKNMDISTDHGIFLGYTSTDRNVYIKSSTSNKVLIGTHTSFDESHMSSPAADLPPMAKAMQEAGYSNLDTSTADKMQPIDRSGLKIQLLNENAVAPSRGTPDSAGLDVSCTEDIVIEPHSFVTIPLHLSVECRPGTYVQLQERSSMAIKGLTLAGGVIDSDYRGNIHAIPINNSNVPVVLKKGQKFAQMIVKHISLPSVAIVNALTPTKRGEKGFGSTDYITNLQQDISFPTESIKSNDQNKSPSHNPFNFNEQHAAAIATAVASDTQLCFSNDPFDNKIVIQIANKGTHPTRGLDLEMCTSREQPRLIGCTGGQPAAKIKKWRSTLRGSYVLSVEGHDVENLHDIRRHISNSSKDYISIIFGTMDKLSMHPQSGVPQLYFDQLHKIGEHLFHLKNDPHWYCDSLENNINDLQDDPLEWSLPESRYARPRGSNKGILPKSRRRSTKLTRAKLRKRSDWKEWRNSEHKQLNQYEAQKMFGKPCPRPPNANTVPFLWTYTIKSDGTLKARGVCNGSKTNSGLITVGDTYAGSLDHTGARLFWATAALKNLKVYGADVSNAFAEAPPPVDPLYMTVDEPFRDWWESLHRDPIQRGYVLPVQKAIQGHPEAPRLWQNLIHSILTNDMKLTPTTHEPCLYSGTFEKKSIYFLRQVDDFAIACRSETIAKRFIDAIDSKMTCMEWYSIR